ncbi:hemagglutinin repeat-containing protein [Stenotrophomonas rhizophila]|uniref:hemagglutinin repeat-containing protein n=1 Tax=Stenotrophomonas rhizophila TaxID=216778 RepID=UPI001E5C1E52|nr:hemagglutinin repeat-containing protein [Stenotrophomonas rhizophila]MCC7633270.1 hemagglutinin repeat-containing protein [Stenotrophomonas rhizophila]MCC7662162.1 hemagglutinin repeat-containing protein [Stenotrophomonas rhizophila]
MKTRRVDARRTVARPISGSRWRIGLLAAVVTAVFGGPFSLFAQVQPQAGSQARQEPAANGVPVVQIAAPNAAGVSHNQYDQYNVGRQGQVLNNSAATTQTQLAGYIQGNANLQPAQSARLILNEVTSSNRSLLQGHVEVAGAAAQVIIANPNGITCDGCGFINTTRGVLTTGTPLFGGDGSLSAFQVGRGSIRIEGAGLDADNLQRIDLLARAVEINAGLWAREANVVVGANHIDYESLAARAIQGDGATTGFGLDVAALGGMYAGKIRLVGTEAGVGVRSDGALVATSGDFVLTSNGDVQLTGRTAAAGNLVVESAGTLAGSGTTQAGADLRLTGRDVRLAGTTYAAGTLDARASGNLDASGNVLAGRLQLGADGNLRLAGQVESRGDIALRAGGQLENAAQVIAANELQARAARIVQQQGARLAAQGALQLQADGHIDNAGVAIGGTGTRIEAGSLANRGQLYSQRDTALVVAGRIDNSGLVGAAQNLAVNAGELQQAASAELSAGNDVALEVGGELVNAGQLIAERSLSVRADHLANTGTTAARDTRLTVGALDNRGVVLGSDTLDIDASRRIDNGAAARLRAGQAINLHAAQLDNAGEIISDGDLRIRADDIVNRQRLEAAQQLRLEARTLTQSRDGLALARQLDVTATGQLDNAGRLHATGRMALDAQALDNTGTVYSASELRLDSSGTLRNAGIIASDATVRLRAQALQNLANGDISSADLLDIEVLQAASNAGNLYAQRALALRATQFDNRGAVYSAGRAELAAAGSLTNQGSLVSVQSLDVQAGSLDSSGDLGSEQADVGLGTSGDLTLTGKTIAAGQLSAQAGGTLRQSGKAYAATGVTLRAERDLQLAGNLDSSAGITLQAGQALTSDGDVYAAGGVMAEAGTVLRNSGSVQAANIALQGGSVENRGRLLASGNVTVTADAVDNSGQIVGGLAANGALGSSGEVTLTARNLLLQSGKVHAGQRVALQGSGLDLRNGLAWSGGELVARATAGMLDNRNGTLVATGTLQLESSGELVNQGGSLQAARLGLVAAALDNRAGELIQTGNDALTLAFSGALRNDGGRIAANATDLTVDVAALYNDAGRIEHAGTGAATVRAGQLGNTNVGLIVGNGVLVVDVADGLTNTNGSQISAGRGADIRARRITNNGGRIDAVGNLQLRATEALQNLAGTVAQRQAGTLQIQAASVDNRTGLIGAEGSAGVTTASLGNQGGNLYARQNLTLDINGDLRNAGGLLYAGGQLQLDTDGVLDNQGGSIEAYAAAGIMAGSVDNRSGRLVVDGSNTLTVSTGGALDNSDGVLGSTQGNIALTAGNITNQRGKLVAGQNAVLQTAQLDNRSGRIHAGADLILDNASATVLNGGGELSAGNLFTLRAASLDNSGGRLVTRSSRLYLGALGNSNGEISAYQQLWAQLQAFQGNGRLFGGAELELHLAGDYLHQAGQQLQSNGRLALNVAGTLTNQGRIETSGALELRANQINNTAAGSISAGNGAGTASATLAANQGIDNLGRIDGDRVQADSAWTTNTGTLMGDQVTLTAGTVTNGRELGSTVPVRDYNEGLIATTGTLAINADAFHNLDGELYSIGDIRIGGRWGGNAQQIVNRSGRIQAERDLVLLALGVRNERRVLQYEQKTYTAADQAGDPDAGRFGGGGTPYEIYQRYCGSSSQSPCFIWRDHGVTNTDTVLEGTRVTAASAASQFLSGRDMLIGGGSVDNIYSAIAAGTNLTINGRGSSSSDNPADWAGVVNNVGLTATKTIQRVSEYEVEYQTCRSGLTCQEEPRWARGVLGTTTVTKEVALPGGNTSITAGRNVTIEARDVNNTVVGTGNGGAAADVGGWNGVGAYVPNLGNGSQAGAATGSAGAPDPVTGIATGPATGTVGGNGQGPKVGAPAPGISGAVKPPQVVGTAQNPLPGLLPPNSGLYTVEPGNQRWLVETDPRFANYGQWLGSDYMFDKLNLNPDQRLKRLGDDFYEQRLVLEQITGLTGRKYLDADLDNGMDQYRSMMDGGVAEAGRLQLTVGIALSAEQMAALDEDIVWMVAQDVGGQQVLVPVVYLSQATADRLQLGGAAIAGESVDIRANNVNNQGMISADSRLSIDAGSLLNDRGAMSSGGSLRVSAVEDIINRDGLIQGGSISLVAGRDLQSVASLGVARIESTGGLELVAGRDLSLVGAQTSAKGNAALQAGRDLNLTTQQSGASGQSFNRTTLDVGGSLGLQAGNDLTLTAVQVKAGNGLSAVAGNDINLNVLGTEQSSRYGNTNSTRQTLQTSGLEAGGSMALQAGQDVNLNAASLTAGNALAVVAGRDLNVGEVTTTDTSSTDIRRKRYSQQTETLDQTVHGSTIKAGGDIALIAGQDATLTAAGVYSDGGTVAVSAGRDVVLATADEDHTFEQDTWSKKKKTFSSTTTTTRETSSDTYAVGTTLSGEGVQIAAGRDISATGVQIGATGDVLLAADRNITVEAATEHHSESFDQSRKKSGVFGGGGASGFGGIGITAGSQKGSTSTSLEQTTRSGSMIGSLEGNVSMIAGGDVTVSGSDVLAGRAADDVLGLGGNIAIQGRNVTLNPAEATEHYQASQSRRRSGLSATLTGTPVDTLRNLQQVSNGSGSSADKAGGYIKELGAAALTLPGINVGYGSSKSQGSVAVDTTTQRGSSLNAAGNVSIRATEGDITVVGSSIAAGGTATLDAQRHVMLLTSTDTRSNDQSGSSSTKQYGASSISPGDMIRHVQGGPNSSGVRTSPYNSDNSDGSSSQQVIGQTGSSINADRINLVSREGDITLQGAQVAAENALNVLAQKGGIELLPGEITRTWQETQRSKQIGDLGGDGYTGSTGVRNELHDVNGRQSEQNSVRTSLTSNKGDISLVAKEDLVARGADIAAGNDVTLVGRNVVLDAATDTLTQAERHRVSQAGGTIALSGYGVQAVQAAEAVQRASEAGDDRMAALYGAQAGYAVKDAMQGTGAAVKVTASVGSSSASSSGTLHQSIEQGSTVSAGRNVTVVATGDGTTGADGYATNGDITLRGAQISAGNNASFDAARDINLLSSQSSNQQDGTSKSGSGSVGVGFGLGGSQNGFTIELAASAARGEMQGNGTTHQATQVEAGNQLSLTSGRDTTLQGAQAMGDAVLAAIGRDLTLTSSQDRQFYDQKDQTGGFGVSLCIPPLCFGASSGSVSYGQTDINNNYNSTTQQTGIAAGGGGYQINVGNHTQLDGAVIASTADPSKNLLSTESLAVTDLSNQANYSGTSFGGSAGFSGSIGDQSNGGANPGAPTGTQWNRPGASPSLGVPQGDSATSVTRSDISAGTVVVRNGDTSALDGLERIATELQNEGLANKFDAEAINRNLEAGRIAGEIGFRAAGDIAAANGWEEGSAERTALHGVVGAAMAALGGGNALDGLSGAVANQLAFKAMYSYLTENMGLDPTSPLFASLMEAGSFATGTAVGGQTGGAVASSATQNNWLKHYEAEQLEEAAKACSQANQQACALAEELRGLSASRDAEYAAYAAKVRAEAKEKGITLSLEEFDRQTAGYWASYDMLGRDAAYPGAVFSRTYPTAGQGLIDSLKLQGQLLKLANKYAPFPIFADTTPVGIGILESAGETYGSWISGNNYFTGESLDPNQQRDGMLLSLVGLFMPGGVLGAGSKGTIENTVRNEIRHELKEEVVQNAANTLRLAKPEFNVPQGYTVKVEADGIATVTGPQGGVYKSTGHYDSLGRQVYSDSSGKYYTLEDGRKATLSPNQNVGKDNATKGQQTDADYGRDLEGTGARPQVAFKDGKEVSPNTPGSVRPDYCIDGVCSIEVKNYNLTLNTSGLIRDISRQAIERVKHLPEGMQQLLVIDIRGQAVPVEQQAAIREAIFANSKGAIKRESIQFMKE